MIKQAWMILIVCSILWYGILTLAGLPVQIIGWIWGFFAAFTIITVLVGRYYNPDIPNKDT